MSLFENTRREVGPKEIAVRQLKNANQEFDQMLRKARMDYQVFWSSGNADPIEVLVEMGTFARTFISIAWARLEMLKTVAVLVGKEDLVNVQEFLPPVALEFNEDGSLKT
jgi:Icc-related predicted phosphoesterase